MIQVIIFFVVIAGMAVNMMTKMNQSSAGGKTAGEKHAKDSLRKETKASKSDQPKPERQTTDRLQPGHQTSDPDHRPRPGYESTKPNRPQPGYKAAKPNQPKPGHKITKPNQPKPGHRTSKPNVPKKQPKPENQRYAAFKKAKEGSGMTAAQTYMRMNETDILTAAMENACEVELENDKDALAAENLMDEVYDLIVTGPDDTLTFQRDFVSEGIEMLNQVRIPDSWDVE